MLELCPRGGSILASAFLPSTHSPPLSPLRFGHGQGTQAEPGQAGPEAAARQQPVPVSAGAWGRGCAGGTPVWAGDCPTPGSSSSPLLSIAHSSGYSSCLPAVVDVGPSDVPAPSRWGSQSITCLHQCALPVGCGHPPSPSEGPKASPPVTATLVAVLAFQCCSSGDRRPCGGTEGGDGPQDACR